jgi:hypothetical protein
MLKQESKHVGTFALLTILIGVMLYLLPHFDLTSFVFPGWNTAARVQPSREVEAVRPEQVSDPLAVPQPPSAAAEPQLTASHGEYFSYKDAKGIIHLGNDPNQGSQQLPQEAPPQAPQLLTQPVPQQVPQGRATPIQPPARVTPPPVVINVAAINRSSMNEFESCRCKNGLATRGDLKQEVLQKCEQPFSTTSNRNCGEIWLYNFGPNEFMQGICFDGNRVKKVLSLDRGF